MIRADFLGPGPHTYARAFKPGTYEKDTLEVFQGILLELLARVEAMSGLAGLEIRKANMESGGLRLSAVGQGLLIVCHEFSPEHGAICEIGSAIPHPELAGIFDGIKCLFTVEELLEMVWADGFRTRKLVCWLGESCLDGGDPPVEVWQAFEECLRIGTDDAKQAALWAFLEWETCRKRCYEVMERHKLTETNPEILELIESLYVMMSIRFIEDYEEPIGVKEDYHSLLRP